MVVVDIVVPSTLNSFAAIFRLPVPAANYKRAHPMATRFPKPM